MERKQAHVRWSGREEASLSLEVDAQGQIQNAQLSGIGGPQFLLSLKNYRRELSGPVLNLPLPKGKEPWNILLRELILKIKGEWKFPFDQDELCHCRVVRAEVVDQAICVGAHTPQKVSERTSASTACGTCRPDVEAIIKYRLGDAS